jgi:hypothetical protein
MKISGAPQKELRTWSYLLETLLAEQWDLQTDWLELINWPKGQGYIPGHFPRWSSDATWLQNLDCLVARYRMAGQ